VATTPTVSIQQARRALDAAIAHAADVRAIVGIAILDAGGHVRVLVRLDGANLLVADWALGKALTAVSIGMPTDEFGSFATSDPTVLAAVSASRASTSCPEACRSSSTASRQAPSASQAHQAPWNAPAPRPPSPPSATDPASGAPHAMVNMVIRGAEWFRRFRCASSLSTGA
jgi:hypothetical protein